MWGRLEIFEVSCNAVGAWYYMACIFLVYLFFRYRKPLLRVFFVLCFVICYLVLAITYSRSSMLGFSISVGMLLVILAFHYFPLRKNASKAVVLVVMMCLGTLLAYKSFGLSTTLMSEASVSVQTAVQEAPVAESSGKSSSEQLIQTTEVLNERGLNSSGRVELWVAAIQSLKEDPGRIITGTINPAILTDQYIREHMPESKYGYRENHHNAYLDILMSSGLPGLLLIMCFLAVLVVKMIRLFFTENRSVPLSVTVMITGILIFNVFESSLFDYTLNTTVFSIVAGYIPVFEKNLHNN